MPRIENSGNAVTKWCREAGEGSSTADICKACERDVEPADRGYFLATLGKSAQAGPEPQGTEWDGDVFHPPYSSDNYTCAICGDPLTDEDN